MRSYDPTGLSNTALYQTWSDMKQRCFNARNPCFSNYGGRGIAVCDDWLGFRSFAVWALSNGYVYGLTIDRIDPDGSYEPANCRWITNQENAGRARHSKHRAKITEQDAAAIREACAAGEPQRIVAAQYGITQSAVSLIVRGINWA